MPDTPLTSMFSPEAKKRAVWFRTKYLGSESNTRGELVQPLQAIKT